MKHKIILEEDDCAPDSREYFNKQLKKEIGIDSANEFIKISEKVINEDYCNSWYYNKYILSISDDNPYYTLWIEED